MRLVSRRQTRESDPRVCRAGQGAPRTHAQVMVRPEEAVKAALLGAACNRQQLLVARTLLGFSEDTQFHHRLLGQAAREYGSGGKRGQRGLNTHGVGRGDATSIEDANAQDWRQV